LPTLLARHSTGVVREAHPVCTMPKPFDPNDPESYFADPRTRRWVVRCAGCGRFGFWSDAPEQFFNRYWLKKKFEPLDLDERALCDVCRAALDG
jgi:hypothetical protein